MPALHGDDPMLFLALCASHVAGTDEARHQARTQDQLVRPVRQGCGPGPGKPPLVWRRIRPVAQLGHAVIG